MIIWSDRLLAWISRAALLGAVAIVAFAVTSRAERDARAASSGPALATVGEVVVYALADESSTMIEAVRAGSGLSPIAEMIGAGGEKWFMVKTPRGNVGWIKADENSQAKRMKDHFRSLPIEVMAIDRDRGAPEPDGQTSTTRAMRIPIRLIGNSVVVPVTVTNGNSSVTGNLLVDTGASQTMLSKRMASSLRLYSHDTQARYGIGGAVSADVSVVESIKVGSARAKNVRVTIHDFSPDPRYEGLLGLDFLGRFQMSVDTAKQVMVLTPHKR